MLGNDAEALVTSEADNGPYLKIPIIPEESETKAVREGIHERMHGELQHKDKEAEMMAEEMLDALPALNEVPDLMMEIEDGKRILEAATKRTDER